MGLNLIFWVLNFWVCVLIQMFNFFMFNLSILSGFVKNIGMNSNFGFRL